MRHATPLESYRLPAFCTCNVAHAYGADLNCDTSMVGVSFDAKFEFEPCDTTPHIHADVSAAGYDLYVRVCHILSNVHPFHPVQCAHPVYLPFASQPLFRLPPSLLSLSFFSFPRPVPTIHAGVNTIQTAEHRKVRAAYF